MILNLIIKENRGEEYKTDGVIAEHLKVINYLIEKK